VINPMIVEGQVHGAIAQGIGQALFESAVYEPDSGQIMTGSFMDYAMPRADILPDFISEADETQPCTHNPLGVKGCGESGTIGAPAAITSAMMDALGSVGVRGIEMPFTSNKIWHALQKSPL
jgi:carbon-monoxide dehydrogenase large subunit